MLADETFQALRRDVLAGWPTGKNVSEEAFEYYQQRGDQGAFDLRLRGAKATGRTLLQPRVGVALPKHQVEILRYLEIEGTADLLTHTVDSYTRNNRYKEVQRSLEMSRETKEGLLNGFPLVNHGVATCRAVQESLSLPVQIRHGSPDGRLLAEISFASGYTAYEGGGITYNLSYSKNIPLDRTIRDWQYVDRLAGYYTDRGVTINRESFGALTGILVPPGIAVSISILEALLAAEQGVKSISLGYAQCGNIIQDVAAIRALESLGTYYLAHFGFNDVALTTVFHEWMGPFPMKESRAMGLIALGAMAAALAGATKVITKTPHEAYGVPTKEANAQGLLCTRLVMDTLANQYPLDSATVDEETRWISQDASAMIEKALELGDGLLASSVVRAFDAGVLDVPFSPSVFTKGKVMPIRDKHCAVRYLEHGNLPLDKESLERNRELVLHRIKASSCTDPLDLMVRDIAYFLEGEGVSYAMNP